jgi:hypothetical protein
MVGVGPGQGACGVDRGAAGPLGPRCRGAGGVPPRRAGGPRAARSTSRRWWSRRSRPPRPDRGSLPPCPGPRGWRTAATCLGAPAPPGACPPRTCSEAAVREAGPCVRGRPR